MQEPFTHNGRQFSVEFVPDDDAGAPWDREDGHGPVTGWVSRDKRPGELVLMSDRGSHVLYDFEAAVRIARRDGWGLTPGRPPAIRARGRIAAEMARKDFERLRDWCNNRWEYVGVCVRLLDGFGEPVTGRYDHALWGIESDAGDYLMEVAHELAGQCLSEFHGVTSIAAECDPVC